MTKIQNSKLVWVIEYRKFGASLEFGAWVLRFLNSSRIHRSLCDQPQTEKL
jgi:hypothetical protein